MEPLRLDFAVARAPEHAFATWATRTSVWWPHGHSVSGEPGLSVHFEPHAGGRIYERTAAGDEHDWGEVLAWEPPRRLAYRTSRRRRGSELSARREVSRHRPRRCRRGLPGRPDLGLRRRDNRTGRPQIDR